MRIIRAYRIHKYILGCVIEKNGKKRFVLFKNKVPALRRLVKQHLLAHGQYLGYKNPLVDELIFDLFFKGEFNVDYRIKKDMLNFLPKLAGNNC